MFPEFPGANGNLTPKTARSMNAKPLLSSTMTIGFLIGVAAKLLKLDISQEEGQQLVDSSILLYTVGAGMIAELIAMWRRITATKFDIDWWKSPAFYAVAMAGVMSVFQAIGVNWEGLEDAPNKIQVVVGTAGSLIGSILMIIGRFRASRPIAVQLPNNKGFFDMGPIKTWFTKSATKPIVEFIQRSMDEISKLDGKPGLSAADFREVMKHVKEAHTLFKKEDKAGKFNYVRNFIVSQFGDKITTWLVAELVVWGSVEIAKLTNALPKV
jgi:hypothetical protein